MSNWFETACDNLETSYARGEITFEEFHSEMFALRRELQGQAEEAAEAAYNDTIGGL